MPQDVTTANWKYRLVQKGKGEGFVVIDERKRRICEGFMTDEPRSTEEKRRMGMLLAAAPTLLSALRLILRDGLNQKTLETAIAAIQKAEHGS